MTKLIENKHIRRLLISLTNRVTKGEGKVAHWIWRQPDIWKNKISCRVLFRKKEYSASFLVAKFMTDDEQQMPRIPNNFVSRPMSHILIPKCGNDRCVRPSHQKWITIEEFKTSTVCRGDDNGKTLMTSKKIKKLYKMLNSGAYDTTPKAEIAEMFGVKIDTIYSHRRKWAAAGGKRKRG